MRHLLPSTPGGLLLLLALAVAVPRWLPADEYRLTPVVAGGLSSPLFLTQATTADAALHVVEQAGTVRLLKAGVLQPTPWLDIRGRVVSGGEQGLLGLAFHPRYAQNGRFFVNYTTNTPRLRTVVSEFQSTPGALSVDASTERELLTFDQPFANHNGGHLAFGPDGRLYIASGDGGSGGDPFGNGQNLQTLLGKILRIDVDGAAPYAIPADNPFADQAPARPETWAYGLRNPWRFSFDRGTGLLFCGDVGQVRLEEIDVIQRGGNYGWDVMEGSLCHEPDPGCNRTGLVLPIAEYGRSVGVSVTGGYVYRGQRLPALRGTYIYGDFASRRIFGLRFEAGIVTEHRQLLTAPDSISSFGEDAAGELYVIGYSTGSIHQFAHLTASVQLSSGLELISLPLAATTTTGTLFTVADLAASSGSPFVAWTEQGADGRGVFRAWIRGLGTIPPLLEGWRAYVLSQPVHPGRRLDIEGALWPASSFAVSLPRGLNLLSVPTTVQSTRTTQDLFTLTGSAFLLTGSPVTNGASLHLAGDAPAGLAASEGYLAVLPAALSLDLLRFQK